MKLEELRAFLAKTRLAQPVPQKITSCSCGYQEILESMAESLSDLHMTFGQAWDYEISHSEITHHGKKAREMIAKEGKTLAMLLSDLEDLGHITNANFYGQPFDLALERELGNFNDE